MKKNTEVPQRKITANELTNVRDIKRNYLYTKDGYVFGYLRVHPMDIDLLSQSEKKSQKNILAGSFKSIDYSFGFLGIPRTVDISDYINYLSNEYDMEIENATRKNLLSVMIREAQKKVLNESNYEHQFFIKVWDVCSGEKSEAKVMQKLQDMSDRYQMIRVKTDILDEVEILKLCNLYANSSNAAVENDGNLEVSGVPYLQD